MDTQALTEQTSALWKMALDYGPRVIGALVVLMVGRLLAKWAASFVGHALEKTKVDATLRPVIASIVRYVVLGLTLLIVLQQFGIETASLLALVGTIGLAVGLALQGTLSNVAAGLMLLFLRPFEVGDHVEAGGSTGVVLGIDMFHTNLRTNDGVDIVVPNSNILSGPIRNMSHFPERVLAMSVNVAADAELGKAVSVLAKTLSEQALVIQDRERTVTVKSLTGGASEIVVNAWVKNDDYQEARSQYLTAVRQALGKAKIALA